MWAIETDRTFAALCFVVARTVFRAVITQTTVLDFTMLATKSFIAVAHA
jgi:hypothetical protein